MSSPGNTPSPSDEQQPGEPHDGINAYENSDARGLETNQSSPLARASDGGIPPVDAPPHGQAPEPEIGGTGGGDPTAGVHISDEDAENAVSGDEGPEHPGVRRNT